MEMFENGQSPENKNNEPEQSLDPDLNKDGGVFAEKDFSNVPSQGAPIPPYQAQGSPYGGGYQSPADNAYRQMYSGAPDYRGYYNQAQNGFVNGGTGGQMGGVQQEGAFSENIPPQSGYSYSQNGYEQPQRGYTQNSGYYYQPQVGAVSAGAPQTELKKSSKGWIIAVIIIVILMFTAIMLLLAYGQKMGKDSPADGSDTASQSASAGGVTVNISVAPKPVEDESFYQNKETGLLTPVGVANQVLPSVVNLYGYAGTTLVPVNMASGIIISEDGYIITNAHATEEVSRFKVRLSDDREFEAKLVGADTQTDLAVMKIEADDITPAVIGSSSDMLQGEEVVAIGNADGYNNTVTVGHVSYVDREVTSYTGYPVKCIQTDAVLNFGNSGGALVNMYGQVVGIVVSRYNKVGGENIGFAISSDFAVPIIEDIIEKGYVTGRARIGIIYTFISPDNAEALGVKPGLMISDISEDCDVAKTELMPDDIITELDGISMITENSIKEFQNTHRAGDVITAKVYRVGFEGGEKEFEITFKLEEMK
ncbi:MAG: S1C family serine protease [Oscillospiraceae bacterium]|nr:S1C family serine protease [Oscillospiraceae bacterium]